jgi:hypothetical protein
MYVCIYVLTVPYWRFNLSKATRVLTIEIIILEVEKCNFSEEMDRKSCQLL